MLKKISTLVLAVSLLFVLTTIAFAWENSITIGTDLLGTHKLSGYGAEVDSDTKTGFSFGYEGSYKFSDGVKLGLGYEMQTPRPLENYSGDFKFRSIYMLVNLPISDNKLEPYIIGRLGGGRLYSDSDYSNGAILTGGTYYAIGIGIKLYHKLDFNFLYSINNGTGEYLTGTYKGLKGDIEYSKFSIVGKYNF
jgi:hypothetical protein